MRQFFNLYLSLSDVMFPITAQQSGRKCPVYLSSGNYFDHQPCRQSYAYTCNFSFWPNDLVHSWALHCFSSQLSLHVHTPLRAMEYNKGLVIKFDTDEKSATLIKCRQSPVLVWHCEIKLLQLNSPTEISEGWLNISASALESRPSCCGRERKTFFSPACRAQKRPSTTYN